MGKRHDEKSNNVRTLENDYVRIADSRAQISKEQKIRFRRRIVAFGLIATIILVFLTCTYITQQKRLTAKQQQKTEVVTELEAVKGQQEMLNLQIAKLEDDEYIAKLARKEYFLSDEGEIIFTIPSEEDIDKNTEEDDK